MDNEIALVTPLLPLLYFNNFLLVKVVVLESTVRLSHDSSLEPFFLAFFLLLPEKNVTLAQTRLTTQ